MLYDQIVQQRGRSHGCISWIDTILIGVQLPLRPPLNNRKGLSKGSFSRSTYQLDRQLHYITGDFSHQIALVKIGKVCYNSMMIFENTFET